MNGARARRTKADVVLLQRLGRVRGRVGQRDGRVRLARGREGLVVDASNLGTKRCIRKGVDDS